MKYFILVLFFSVSLFGSSGGKIGSTKKNGNGCSCHGNLNSNVSVIISGPDTIKVGEVKNYSITVTGGALAAAGFNVATTGGKLTKIDGQEISGELTHSSPIAAAMNKVVFQFSFSSTTAGSGTIYATGNSVNLNGTDNGDAWNHAINKSVTILPATNLNAEMISPRDYFLKQNYPNPFNNSTVINFGLNQKSKIKLAVYDLSGKIVALIKDEIIEAGNHKINFEAKDLTSGNYLYVLKTEKQSISKIMTLVK